MIRRSERIVRQEVNGIATKYRVTRIHVFGCCVYTDTRETEPPMLTYRVASPGPPIPDDTAEFNGVSTVTGGVK